MKAFLSVKNIARTIVMALAVSAASCVHEFPEVPETRKVELTVTHKKEWTEYDHVISRGISPENTIIRYHFLVTQPDDHDTKVSEKIIYSDDLTRPDFTTTLDIPTGSYDIWAWSDHAHPDSRESVHHDTGDFANITYTQPYNGNDDRRDAFRGTTPVTVEASTEAETKAHATLELERPFAKYRFVATDLEEFIGREISRRSLAQPRGPNYAPLLGIYRVKMIYTGYMPSKFNNFINRPVDSSVGVSYDGTITQLDDGDALLSFDYVMVNGHESSIPVAVEIYDGKTLIANTGAINVPIVRNRLTTVRGKFLTSRANEGVGIDPGFDGDFNIEIK